MCRMRIHDSKLDEEEREHGEDHCLDEADEHLESHERRRHKIRREESDYGEQDFAREDVAEETERERYETRRLAHELDKSNNEIEEAFTYAMSAEIDEFPRVFEKSESHNPGDLDDNDSDDRERERHVEIGVDAPQERREFLSPKESDGADAGREFEDVGGEDEKEDREQKREIAARKIAIAESLGDEIVHIFKKPLEEQLESAGNELDAAAYHKRDHDEYRHHDPARYERIRDRN